MNLSQSRRLRQVQPRPIYENPLEELSSVPVDPSPRRHGRPKVEVSRQHSRGIVHQPERDTLRTANADLQSQIQELELANRELIGVISVLSVSYLN
jgi:hypothetical protein